MSHSGAVVVRLGGALGRNSGFPDHPGYHDDGSGFTLLAIFSLFFFLSSFLDGAVGERAMASYLAEDGAGAKLTGLELDNGAPPPITPLLSALVLVALCIQAENIP